MKSKYHVKEFKSFKELTSYMNKMGSAPVLDYVAPSTRIKAVFEGDEIVEAPKPKPAPLPPKPEVNAKPVLKKKVEVETKPKLKKKRKTKVSKKDA